MPFDPDAYIASKETEFDPDAYLSEKDSESVESRRLSDNEIKILAAQGGRGGPDSGKLDTITDFLAGVSRGVPFAHQIGSALEAPFSDKTYSELMEEKKRMMEMAQARSPVATTTGEISSGIASTAAIPGGFRATAALEGLEEGTREMDIGEGLKAGAIGGGVAKGFEKFVKLPGLGNYLSKRFGDTAAESAEAAAGLGDSKTLRQQMLKMQNKGKVDELELGKALLEDKLVRSNPEDMYKAIAAKRREYGEGIGEILEEGSDIDPLRLSDKLAAKADEIPKTGKEMAQKKQALLSDAEFYEDLAGETAGIRPSDLLQQKQILGKSIKKDLLQKGTVSKEADKLRYGAVSDAIEESVGDQKKELYKNLNKKFSRLSTIEEAALGKAAKVTGDMSPFESYAAYTSLGLGRPEIVAVMKGRATLRKHLDAWKAIGFDKADNWISKVAINPKWVEKLNRAAEAGSLPAAHFHLLQTDPDYRDLRNMEAEDERTQ